MIESVLGEQLSFVFEGEPAACRIPWEGRSPRALTRGAKWSIFEAQAGKSVGEVVDPEQIDFWLPGPKAPRLYLGAPSLFPLED